MLLGIFMLEQIVVTDQLIGEISLAIKIDKKIN